MSDVHSLPFELNDDSLGKWLESISNSQPVKSSSQLNQAINQLRKKDCDDILLFPLLLKLTPVAFHLASSLVTPIKSGPQQHQTIKVAKLSQQLLRNLSLAFCGLLNNEQLTKQEKLEASFYSLQLIGHYLRISSLLHELPSTTLWHRSGSIFQFAEKNEGLEQTFTTRIQEFKTQTTIKQVLKRNLLFTIAAFRQQSTTDNQAIFNFANQYANLMAWSDQQSDGQHFVWNFKKGIPCLPERSTHPLKQNEIALNISNVLAHLQFNSFTPPLSQNGFEILHQHLTGYRNLISDSIPAAPVIFTLLCGFDMVYGFLKNQEKLRRIQKLSAQSLENRQPSSLSLEPLEHEKSLLSSFSKNLEYITHQNSSEIARTVKVLESKHQHFLHAETKKTDCRLGDLVMLVNNKNIAIPGMIRQITPITNTQSNQLLIEKINGVLTTRTVQSEPYQNNGAIIINEKSEHPEILLRFDNYHTGSEFSLSDSLTIHLDSVLDYSPSFVRFQVDF